MRLISRIEEIILLSIWRLQNNAYGITIVEEVQKAKQDDCLVRIQEGIAPGGY